jgi:hypothetical protein
MASKMASTLLNQENIDRIKNMKSTIRFPAQVNHSIDSIFYHHDTGISIYIYIYLFLSICYIIMHYIVWDTINKVKAHPIDSMIEVYDIWTAGQIALSLSIAFSTLFLYWFIRGRSNKFRRSELEQGIIYLEISQSLFNSLSNSLFC